MLRMSDSAAGGRHRNWLEGSAREVQDVRVDRRQRDHDTQEHDVPVAATRERQGAQSRHREGWIMKSWSGPRTSPSNR